MKKLRSDAQKTRLRLLESASEVFAKKGFHDATHEDICGKAMANTAAINYHFGSKENLFIEAWKYSFERSISKYPTGGGVPSSETAEKRLRGTVLSILQRIADPEAHEIEILHKEMVDPSGLLTEVITEAIAPLHNNFKSLLHEIIGEGASEQEIVFLTMSVMSLCFAPMQHLRYSDESHGIPRPDFLQLDFGVERLAYYITKFSLGGIRSLREISE